MLQRLFDGIVSFFNCQECGGLYDIVVDLMYKLHASKLRQFISDLLFFSQFSTAVDLINYLQHIYVIRVYFYSCLARRLHYLVCNEILGLGYSLYSVLRLFTDIVVRLNPLAPKSD